MRKRERENPCGVCGHYHQYELGEVCGVCGHRIPMPSDKTGLQISAFPSEILPEFLYLGSYDNASRAELLKTQGITRILNTVPSCQNLYKNSFTYYCLEDDKTLPFDDAIRFLEQCEKEKARVLVHCMSGKNRSPAIVISYLMKSKGWRLQNSYQWVKDRRPAIDLNQAVYEQLQQYEQTIFGSTECSTPVLPVFQPSGLPAFSFGLPKTDDVASSGPVFNSNGTSVFSRSSDVPPNQFTFGADRMRNSIGANSPQKTGGNLPMDS